MPDTSPPVDPALPTVREFWDTQSTRYDEDPDHGLRDPAAREAWRAHLTQWLPEPPATVLDLGCGTGSLSLLALEAGHRVRGVDLSPAMVAEDLVAALDPLVERLEVVCLSGDSVLWGRDVDDERYAVVATAPTG